MRLLMVRTDVEESKHHMPFVSRACPLLEAGWSVSAVSNNLHFAVTADFAVLQFFSVTYNFFLIRCFFFLFLLLGHKGFILSSTSE